MAGRPRKYNLNNSKELISVLYWDDNKSVTEIRDHLAWEWGVPLQQVPSERTLRTQLKNWGIQISKAAYAARSQAAISATIYNDETLIEEVRSLWLQGLQQSEMLRQLKASNWPDLSLKQLTKLRQRNNIYLRTAPGKEEEAKVEAQRVVKK